MSQVIDVLESLEATTKRLEKEAILTKNKDNTLLKWILTVTLDPYTTFGLKKLKAKPKKQVYSIGPDEDDFVYTWLEFLTKELATRKLTGNAAKVAAQKEIDQAAEFSPRLGVWFERILLRNLRIGVQEKTVNKIWPGSVRPFAVQLANVVEADTVNDKIEFKEQLQYPLQLEPKLDGLRLIAIKNNGIVQLYTRNGTELETLPELVADLEACSIDNIVLDGEGCADGDQSVAWNESASVMMSSKNKKNASNIKYNVFDMMTLEEWVNQKCGWPLTRRRADLEELMQVMPGSIVRVVPKIIVNSDEELIEMYKKFLDMGYEGVMLKDLQGKYEFKRTDAIRKLKPTSTYEGVVVGWYEGKLGTKREGLFGGFNVLLPTGAITNVGSGFSDELKARVWAEGPDTYVGKIVECAAQPPLTSDGKMRFPRLVRFRDPSDVDPKVIETFENYCERVVQSS